MRRPQPALIVAVVALVLAGTSFETTVNLPGRAPVGIDDAHIVNWPGAHCAGEVSTPQPDPGYVCISQFGSSFKGPDSPAQTGHAFNVRDVAFVVDLVNIAADSAFTSEGAWAYLAP